MSDEEVDRGVVGAILACGFSADSVVAAAAADDWTKLTSTPPEEASDGPQKPA